MLGAIAALVLLASACSPADAPEVSASTAPSSTARSTTSVAAATTTSEAAPPSTEETTLPPGSVHVTHGTGELSVILPAEWFTSYAYAPSFDDGWSLGAGAVISSYDPGDNFVVTVGDEDASDRVEIWVPATVDPTATTDPAVALDAGPRFDDCDEPARELVTLGGARGLLDRYRGCGERLSERWQVAVLLPEGVLARVSMSVTGEEVDAVQVLDLALGSLEFEWAPPVEPVDPSECQRSAVFDTEPMGFSVTNASDIPAQLVIFDPTCSTGDVFLIGRIGPRERIGAQVLPGQLVAAADYDGTVRRTFVVGPGNSFAIN